MPAKDRVQTSQAVARCVVGNLQTAVGRAEGVPCSEVS